MPETGILRVSTTPVAGDIYVDGNFIGRGYALDEVAPGSYLVSFGPVDGYVVPAYQTVIVNSYMTTEVTGVYVVLPHASGTLRASTTPVDGDIYVNGDLAGKGSISVPLLVGSYTISFGEVIGYNTPGYTVVDIFENQTSTLTGVYSEIPPNGNGNGPPNGNGDGNGVNPPIPWVPIAVVSAVAIGVALLIWKK